MIGTCRSCGRLAEVAAGLVAAHPDMRCAPCPGAGTPPRGSVA